jgi:hypothetical protein
MFISLQAARKAAVGAAGAGALTGAILFGGAPVAQAAPAPTPATHFATFGPESARDIPDRPGGGRGPGGGHGWGGRGGGWGGRGGGWGGGRGGWGGGVGRGWDHHRGWGGPDGFRGPGHFWRWW